MSLTFETLIAHNKRASWALVLGLIIFLALLAGVFGVVLTGGDPEEAGRIFSLAAIVGACFAIFGSLFSYYFGASVITAVSGARELAAVDDPMLFNVVAEMAIAAGVPMPKVYLINDPSPNAFATGRDPKHAIVGVTTGLRDKLSRDELQAVIAHELGHIKNFDIRLMMLVGVYAGIVVLLSDFFLRSFGHAMWSRGRSATSSRSNNKANPLGLILMVFAVLLALIAPLIANLLQLAVSREREYLADATAVKFCRNPLALASALRKISMDPEPLKCDNRATEHLFIVNPSPKLRLLNPNKDSIWMTHPPVIKRIARLNALSGEYGQQVA